MRWDKFHLRAALASTALALMVAGPVQAQVSVSTDDGLGVSADLGGISADANVSISNGIGADVDASVGGPSGVNATADADTGGPSGTGANANASIGGDDGISADANLGTGGSNAVDADVTASIGGDGSNGGIEGDVTSTIGDLLGLNVDLGIGGAPVGTVDPTTPSTPTTPPGGVAQNPDTENGARRGSSVTTGPGNGRVAAAVEGLSPQQMTRYRQQCRSILADPDGFDTDLVGMCRMLGRN